MNRKLLLGFCAMLTVIVSVLGFTGCTVASVGNLISESGLTGEHKLKRIENFGTIQGSLSGSFFLGIGTVNGTVGSELRLQFYWEPKPGEIAVTTLPYNKFRFVVDNAKEIPTVEFVFGKNYLLRTVEIYKDDYIPYTANPNTWVMDNPSMVVAIVRISEADLEREVYLPKAR